MIMENNFDGLKVMVIDDSKIIELNSHFLASDYSDKNSDKNL